MFCRQCGTQVNDDDKFCVNCGFKLKEESDVKQDVLAELEKDFSYLDSKLENKVTLLNITDEYPRKKWITVILFLIPIFLFVVFYISLFKETSSIEVEEVTSYDNVPLRPKAEDLIKKLELEPEEEEKFIKAIEDLGVYIKQITSVEYAPELEGMYTYSKDENSNGTEDGYRLSLSNGKKISVYVQDGKFLAIYYLNDFVYKDGNVVKSFKQVDEEVEESKFKHIKVGETIKTVKKEITINSVEFKKEVHPPNKTSYYNYYKADDGQVYIHILASVKNLDKQSIYCDEVIDIEADYNKGYKYYAFSTVEDNVIGFTYSNIRTVDPLETKNIHYLISVPEEVKTNTDTSLALTFIADNEEYRLKLR